MAHLQLTRIITSPFLRTLETAQQIHQTTGIVPEVRTALHEKGGCVAGFEATDMFGQAGMTRAEIHDRFPGYQVEPEIDGQGWWGGRPMETPAQARQRAEQLFTTSCREFSAQQRVAFVMHGDFLMLFLACFHRAPVNLAWNASLSRVAVHAREAKLLEYSCVEHLPNYLVTW